jgi:hypothetical protein
MVRRLALCTIVACTIIATLGLGSSTAAAQTTDTGRIRYRDTGFDPDDRPATNNCCVRDPDIRSSTRTVLVDHVGSWLLVKFRTYDYLLGYWTVRVSFDARGGSIEGSADAPDGQRQRARPLFVSSPSGSVMVAGGLSRTCIKRRRQVPRPTPVGEAQQADPLEALLAEESRIWEEDR